MIREIVFLLPITYYLSLITDFMEPEIARRCKACGAAIRARSAFCPQCGLSLTEDAASTPNSVAAAVAEEPRQAATDAGANLETVAPVPKMEAALQTEAALKAEAPAQAEEPLPAEAPVKTEAPVGTEAPAPGDVSGETLAAPVLPVQPVPPLETQPLENAVVPGATAADSVQGKRQRVTAAAREVVDESVRPRAEKLRRASNVVLDEAAADPSLRFVLVATALIILSLLLLLLGRVL